jgi:hypothetical protein
MQVPSRTFFNSVDARYASLASNLLASVFVAAGIVLLIPLDVLMDLCSSRLSSLSSYHSVSPLFRLLFRFSIHLLLSHLTEFYAVRLRDEGGMLNDL